ncbi:ABC transporter family protein [Tritrichomonas foetus]|uniref:ABC transporter family protein n=1 Tax=Tritrichomonas foetus TaxID=1144522 RepID=A0A1J4JCK7_9EUKA|nr:ABC transporter family protein [Tritrichomonas foetus]|eukprot:OHS96840.1 ABC transporter family protein [Tritrichomonas foetus]
MRNITTQVFSTQGSNDDVEIEITGWEWIKIIKLMKNKWIYIIALITNIFSFSGPFIYSSIQGRLATVLIDSRFDTSDEFLESTNKLTNLLIFAAFILFLMNVISSITDAIKSPQYLREIRTAVFKALLNQELGYFDTLQTGIVLSRLQDDTTNAFEAYTTKLMTFVRMIVNWFFGFFILLSINLKVTLIAMICLPFFGLTQFLGNKAIRKIWKDYSESTEAVGAKAEEILSSFRTVRSFDAENREYKAYKDKLKNVHNVEVRASRVHGAKECGSQIALWTTTSLILFYLGLLASRGEIEPGAIINIMYMMQAWSNSFAGIFSNITQLQQSNVSSAKLVDILERKSKVPINVGCKMGNVTGRITFRNVTFSYPGRDEPAIDNLSFTVDPGETVAIVGESGCGKSTTLLLLQRFYDPQNGEILVDDYNIKNVDPISLRSQIAIVPQNPVMFTMTVKDNIRYGKPDADRDKVIQAAEIANAHNFVRQLSKGYKTEVEQNSLSGGQKQRLCIARAVMISAPILLLDEATAALDTESERLVQDALQNYRQGKTAILIAHRLATVRNADRIIVMNKGKIVETGTHDELIEKSGFYAHLIQHQLQ